jgi:hypothetical protein
MTVGFGPHLELFENSIFLVLCNRLVTCLIAFVYIAFTNTDVQPAAPLRSYASGRHLVEESNASKHLHGSASTHLLQDWSVLMLCSVMYECHCDILSV